MPRDGYGLGEVANAGDLECLSFGRETECELPVDVGQDPVGGELNAGHGCGDHGLLVVGSDDDTGDGDLLFLSPRYSYRYAEE